MVWWVLGSFGYLVAITATYTYLRATQPEQKIRLEIRRPRHIASFNATYRFDEGRGRVNLDVQYNGPVEDGEFNGNTDRDRVTLKGYALVNMAGVLRFDDTGQLETADWQRVIDINLTGTMLLCREVLPHLIDTGGSIVNAASTAALAGLPCGAAYSASKGAVAAFTRAVALQYADQGIRANSIAPGLMNTPMIVEPLAGAYAQGDVEKMIEARDRQCPMGRMGDAWDVAYAALFLLSDEAKYVTGTELVVDGGITAQIGAQG